MSAMSAWLSLIPDAWGAALALTEQWLDAHVRQPLARLLTACALWTQQQAALDTADQERRALLAAHVADARAHALTGQPQSQPQGHMLVFPTVTGQVITTTSGSATGTLIAPWGAPPAQIHLPSTGTTPPEPTVMVDLRHSGPGVSPYAQALGMPIQPQRVNTVRLDQAIQSAYREMARGADGWRSRAARYLADAALLMPDEIDAALNDLLFSAPPPPPPKAPQSQPRPRPQQAPTEPPDVAEMWSRWTGLDDDWLRPAAGEHGDSNGNGAPDDPFAADNIDIRLFNATQPDPTDAADTHNNNSDDDDDRDTGGWPAVLWGA